MRTLLLVLYYNLTPRRFSRPSLLLGVVLASCYCLLLWSGPVLAGPVFRTAHGFEPIQKIHIGELVWSRDERTGKTSLQRVTATIVHQHTATLLLSFAGGAKVETIAVHPFYALGRGFVKAGSLGIGNSIVTRAGPLAKIIGIRRDYRSTTVYNLTIEGLHTYFVGRVGGGLWVHNQDCPDLENLQPGEIKGDPEDIPERASDKMKRNIRLQNEVPAILKNKGWGIYQSPKPATQDFFFVTPSGERLYGDAYCPESTNVSSIYNEIKDKAGRRNAPIVVLYLKRIPEDAIPALLSGLRKLLNKDLNSYANNPPQGQTVFEKLRRVILIMPDGTTIDDWWTNPGVMN